MQLFSSLSLLLLLLLLIQVCVSFPGANLTSSLDRIKIVFTPMMCRRVCSGGRCHNSCEKGDVTTVYSETPQQQPQPKNQGFRLCECHLRAPSFNSYLCLAFLSLSTSTLLSHFLQLPVSLNSPCVSIQISHSFF